VLCAERPPATTRVRARLEAAGLRVVQVDAPALRELLPLRAAHRPDYVAWPVDAFRIVTGGGANSAQVHSH
jgi:5-methyltetrahydropteroyltriglutamate--homocysteine methyltransferase